MDIIKICQYMSVDDVQGVWMDGWITFKCEVFNFDSVPNNYSKALFKKGVGMEISTLANAVVLQDQT